MNQLEDGLLSLEEFHGDSEHAPSLKAANQRLQEIPRSPKARTAVPRKRKLPWQPGRRPGVVTFPIGRKVRRCRRAASWWELATRSWAPDPPAFLSVLVEVGLWSRRPAGSDLRSPRCPPAQWDPTKEIPGPLGPRRLRCLCGRFSCNHISKPSRWY